MNKSIFDKNKIQIGDYVKIIKKLPYKDIENIVEIGDIGKVNYIASTGKYSVHINGKKNPHDIGSLSKQRNYGKLFDFWIPFSCCEKITNEDELMRKCLFENADALDQIKEREEINMKEIRNQSVVDLYFSRKQEEFDKLRDKKKKEILQADVNYTFAAELQRQLDEYSKDKEELANIKLDIQLPVTKESNEMLFKIDAEFLKLCKSLAQNKKEVISMLSGCETYDQEMVILKSYGIVSEDNTMNYILVD